MRSSRLRSLEVWKRGDAEIPATRWAPSLPVTAPGSVKRPNSPTTSQAHHWRCGTALLSQEGTNRARSQVAPRPCSCRHLALSTLQDHPSCPQGQPCFLEEDLQTKTGKLPLLSPGSGRAGNAPPLRHILSRTGAKSCRLEGRSHTVLPAPTLPLLHMFSTPWVSAPQPRGFPAPAGGIGEPQQGAGTSPTLTQSTAPAR